MTLRLKRHWFRGGGAREPRAVASAVAATTWKVALHGVENVRRAKFAVETGAPFIAMLDEFLAFLVAAADRIAYRHDSGEWREAFTVALALRLADLYAESLDDLVGGDPQRPHRSRFIDLVNERMGAYAASGYDDGAPNADFLRQFGYRVTAVLADEADRRWSLDQIMWVEAPTALESLESVMRGVLGLDAGARRRSDCAGE